MKKQTNKQTIKLNQPRKKKKTHKTTHNILMAYNIIILFKRFHLRI